jgi:glutamate-5-semialdehyde dehydrogenase
MSLTDSAAVDVACSASLASRHLATLSNSARNDALTALHQALDRNRDAILAANARDVEAATKAANNGSLNHSVLKRLDLSRPGKYEDMLQGILNVRDLEDPGAPRLFDLHNCSEYVKREANSKWHWQLAK